MSLVEEFLSSDDQHPIDIVETLAEWHDWEFDRVTDDQIAMAVEGQWRTYSLTLAWSAQDETLRLICTFEMEPPADRIGALYDVLNRCNDMVWTGAFTWWEEQKLMVWRYGLLLSGGQYVTADQIDRLIAAAVAAAERFYPAFQLVSWGGKVPAEAMNVAIAEAYGRA
ncbi:MAG: YbjN domain-containing protein [Paracoccaceae bacterium]